MEFWGIRLTWLDCKSKADLSSLTVLRTISQSDDEAQKFHGKQIHKPMEYTFLDYFHFCLVKSTVLRHICHIYDHLVDKIRTLKPYVENYNPNKAIVKSRYISSTLSKWRKTMNIHWAKLKSSKQSGKVHILLKVFLAIHVCFYVFPTPAFSSF